MAYKVLQCLSLTQIPLSLLFLSLPTHFSLATDLLTYQARPYFRPFVLAVPYNCTTSSPHIHTVTPFTTFGEIAHLYQGLPYSLHMELQSAPKHPQHTWSPCLFVLFCFHSTYHFLRYYMFYLFMIWFTPKDVSSMKEGLFYCFAPGCIPTPTTVNLLSG